MAADVREEMETTHAAIEDVKLSIKKQRLDLQALNLKFERLAVRNPEIAKELGWAPEAEETDGGEKRGPGRPKKAEAAPAAAAPAAAPAKK